MRKQSSDHADVLLIDRAAAAELPLAEHVREWAREKRAFISSLMGELSEERQAAATSIRSVGLRPVLFEEFGGRDADPEGAYLAEVEACDIYVGILGKGYGKPLKTRFSATHTEYLHALKHGLRMALWTLTAPNREGHEQSFLDEVRTFHVVPEFRSATDLKRQIEERMQTIAAEDLAPWCKLGNAVFRATEVEDRGPTISVTARVKDDGVARFLEDARGDAWNRGTETRFTWSGRSRYVKVVKVHVKTTSSKSRMFHLEFEVKEAPQDHFLEISFGNKTPSDLTEISLRTVLFGEPNPLSNQHMGFMTELDDPLNPLREGAISEEIIRPVSELLVTDVLVGTGRARAIREFRLGVPLQGHRKLMLSWEVPNRYSSDPVAIRSISGDVKI